MSPDSTPASSAPYEPTDEFVTESKAMSNAQIQVPVENGRTPDEIALILKALDPGMSVKYSEYTHQWYVEASIETGDGSILTGGSEHRDAVYDALLAYFARLTDLSLDEYVVSRYRGHRREWRWNGAAFAECTRDEALPHV